jgi:hypothetical protein
MSFPGKKAGTAHSFGDPKGVATEHSVTKPPKMSKYKDCTMAEYANIESGEKLGERGGKSVPHVRHKE